MSFDSFNNCSTSATLGLNSENYHYGVWPTVPHCHKTECGKLCHKGINCMILKHPKKKGEFGKVYCKECDEVFESDFSPCEDENPKTTKAGESK